MVKILLAAFFFTEAHNLQNFKVILLKNRWQLSGRTQGLQLKNIPKILIRFLSFAFKSIIAALNLVVHEMQLLF